MDANGKEVENFSIIAIMAVEIEMLRGRVTEMQTKIQEERSREVEKVKNQMNGFYFGENKTKSISKEKGKNNNYKY